jgi:hypothetical protein
VRKKNDRTADYRYKKVYRSIVIFSKGTWVSDVKVENFCEFGTEAKPHSVHEKTVVIVLGFVKLQEKNRYRYG